MAKKVTRRKKATRSEQPVGLQASDVLESIPREATQLAKDIASDGGTVIGTFRDPFGGRGLVLAVLPIDQVEPTPFQRDASKAHAQKLERVIEKIGRFLDPIIVIRHEPKRYWTPNGNHRLFSMRALNAQAITALVVPEEDAAYQILALNTEKAHNLREKALEVIRMAHSFADLSRQPKESDYAFQFEEPALLTLGLCYEKKARFSGGPYQFILRRGEAFLDEPMANALEIRTKRAEKLLELDELADGFVKALKERGLTSPYLKPFVVSRLNPFRFQKDAKPPIDEVLAKMLAAAKKFDPAKIRAEEVSRASGPPVAEGEE
jgi:ParB family chromosome partitioning protein